MLAACVAIGALVFFVVAYFIVNIPSPSSAGWRDLCDWDCPWYARIATAGYNGPPNPRTLQTVFGFFPAFPVAVSLLMHMTGLPFETAGLTLNAVFSALFCWLAFEHHKELGLSDERETAIFLAAFLLSPWSLYNRVPYTEMLFNLATLGTFIAWRRGNYVTATAFGCVLSAVRFSGVLLPLALLVELLVYERARALNLLVQPDGRIRALSIMPLGLMAFMLFLDFQVGDPLAYVHAQQIGWNQGLRNPFAILWEGLWVGPTSQYAVLAFILMSGALIAGTCMRRIPIALAAFAWLAPAVAVTSVLAGQPRYSLALFPIYLLAPAVPRRLQLIAIAVLAIGQMIILYYWVRHSQALQ